METLRASDLNKLYGISEAVSVGLKLADFGAALEAIAKRCLPVTASYSETVAFCEGLHLKDIALAQSCARGNPKAWEQFLGRFSPRLYAAALVLTRHEGAARDLADSVWGDLFVTYDSAEAGRLSRLASYTGRGSLEGWLKAILSNSYIDRHRSRKREVSLEERIDILRSLCVCSGRNARFADSRLDVAIEQAFSRCEPEDRALLAMYFFDGRTQKEIARTLGIHESSASRRLERVLRELRRVIQRNLQKRGLPRREIKELLEAEDWTTTVDVRRLLSRPFAQD